MQCRIKKPHMPVGAVLNANEFHSITPEILAAASGFRVSYFFGRGAWDHRHVATLADAKAAAAEMNVAYTKEYSRRALVYARFPNGWSILVPPEHLA